MEDKPMNVWDKLYEEGQQDGRISPFINAGAYLIQPLRSECVQKEMLFGL